MLTRELALLLLLLRRIHLLAHLLTYLLTHWLTHLLLLLLLASALRAEPALLFSRLLRLRATLAEVWEAHVCGFVGCCLDETDR